LPKLIHLSRGTVIAVGVSVIILVRMSEVTLRADKLHEDSACP